jgi:hypothetical protein
VEEGRRVWEEREGVEQEGWLQRRLGGFFHVDLALVVNCTTTDRFIVDLLWLVPSRVPVEPNSSDGDRIKFADLSTGRVQGRD